MIVDVLPGTFGDVFEDQLRAEHGVTCGHWPQSMALSTVGGWVACRGAGQLSTRYGKIEDIVTGLDVVLADGTEITTGGAPRAAVGPDLTQLFVGSEGTLGVIVGARLRAHPSPAAEGRAAYAFTSFTDALDAMRRIVQRGATPAVLRLYDAIEGDRSYHTGDANVLLVLDEGDAHIVDATMRVVAEECATAEPIDVALVEQWMGHRNDVSALEVAGAARLRRRHDGDRRDVAGVARDLRAHDRSDARGRAHARRVGAPEPLLHRRWVPLLHLCGAAARRANASTYYRAMWDAGQRSVLAAGGALSHHHGIGLNRARFVPDALGAGFDVLDRGEAGARPERDPQPRQARAALAFRRAPLAVTSEQERAGRRRRDEQRARGGRSAPTARSCTKSPASCSPTRRPTVWCSSTRRRWRRTALEMARAALAAAGPVDAVGISNQRASTVVWDRSTGAPIGPGIGWQDLRTVGDCLALRAEGLRVRAEPVGHQGQVAPRPVRSEPRPRPLLRHRRHVDRVGTHRRRRARHRRDATPQSPVSIARTTTCSGTPKCSSCCTYPGA